MKYINKGFTIRIFYLLFILFQFYWLNCDSREDTQPNKGKRIAELPELQKFLLEFSQPRNYTAKILVTEHLTQKTAEYRGTLIVERKKISKLKLKRESELTITYDSTQVTIQTGLDKPLQLQLNNPAHETLGFREIMLLEPNILRRLAAHYTFKLAWPTKEKCFVSAYPCHPASSIGLVVIEILLDRPRIQSIEVYGKTGDLASRTQYSKFITFDTIAIATQIDLSFSVMGKLIRETCYLQDLRVKNYFADLVFQNLQ